MAINIFPGQVEWLKEAEKLFDTGKICTYKLYSATGGFIGKITGNLAEPNEVDMSLIIAKNISVIKTTEKAKSATEGYITKNMWTCACGENFIQHRLAVYCRKCKYHISDLELRLPPIESILQWNLPVIDASQYVIPEEFWNM